MKYRWEVYKAGKGYVGTVEAKTEVGAKRWARILFGVALYSVNKIERVG